MQAIDKLSAHLKTRLVDLSKAKEDPYYNIIDLLYWSQAEGGASPWQMPWQYSAGSA